MNREIINIYFNKKKAFIGFSLALCLSIYLSIAIWIENNSLLVKIGEALLGLLFIYVSILGIFTLFQKKFKYVNPGTPEYENKDTPTPIFLIFDNRIEARVNPQKVIYYKDLISIVAIPRIWTANDYMEYQILIEIKDSRGEKIRLNDPENYEFLTAFRQNQDSSLRKMPTEEEFEEKFGEFKLWILPVLGKAKRLGIVIWDK